MVNDTVNEIIRLMRDVSKYPPYPLEEVRRHLEEILQQYKEDLCDDCEWYHNCDSCDQRMGDEPQINEGHL
jgi:hypothetical protein